MSSFRSIVQNVQTDANNSTTNNINAGVTWNSAGTGTSTLGVAGIQVNIAMDQNALVYVDQSMNQTNWDITDTFNYYASTVGNSWTVQATASYVRVRVKNTGTLTTTAVRVQTVLCPIVEAIPRSLDSYGNLKVGVKNITGMFDIQAMVTPTGALKETISTRLVGASFYGTTPDLNFWSLFPTSDGGVDQVSSSLTLRTNSGGPTADSAILVQSINAARYVPGFTAYFRGQITLPVVTTSTGSNTRRWGAYGIGGGSTSDGFFFEANQAMGDSVPTLTLVCRKGADDSNRVDSGSFNGLTGSSYNLDNNNHTCEIYWNTARAFFVIDNILIHTFVGATATLADTFSLSSSLENINAGGNDQDNSMIARSASIFRLGQLLTQPRYKFQSGTTAGIICKYGPGNIHSMIIAESLATSVVTLRDGITTGGAVIFTFTATSSNIIHQPFNMEFNGVAFSTGLFLEITTASSNVTLIYE